ncbi:MAG: 4Fe-4S binding protein [Coriobacteriia bacterium]
MHASRTVARARDRRARRIRWTLLSIVLAFMTAVGYLHQTLGGEKPAGVDALCPFGGLETLATLMTDGAFVRRVTASSVVLLIAVVAVALVSGRAFCGQICPLGALQEGFARLGQRLFGKRLSVPRAIDVPARYLKYLVLIVFLGLTWSTAELAIRPYDPWAAYQHLTSGEGLAEFGIGLAVLVLALAGSLAYDRFFCKYLCPMGAFLGLMSKVRLLRIRRDAETCVNCSLCDRACPMNIEVSSAETVQSAECIGCNECVTACPVPGALSVRSSRGRALSPALVTVLVAVTFTAIVATGAFAGQFTLMKESFASERNAFQAGGELPDTSLIKGSTTWTEIRDGAGIPAAVITSVFGIPEPEQDRALKDTRERYGVSPGEVRYWVELYLTDPAAAGEYVPGAAFEHSEDEGR